MGRCSVKRLLAAGRGLGSLVCRVFEAFVCRPFAQLRELICPIRCGISSHVMELFDKDRLEGPWSRLESSLHPGARLIVEGPTGSGRSMLLERLANLRGFVPVEPPPLGDADAILHALVQLAGPLNEQCRSAVYDTARPLSDRVQEAVHAIAQRSIGVAMRLPLSWKLGAGSERALGPDQVRWAKSAREFLEAVSAPSTLELVILVASASDLPESIENASTIRLKRMEIRAETIQDLSTFGSYADAAEFVAARCRSLEQLPTPIQFRVAVGLRGIGALHESDLGLLERSGSNLTVLEQRLVRALARRPALARSVFRVALARRPLPRDQVVLFSGIPTEHAPLVTECLAYGAGTVKMHERIRRAILRLGLGASVVVNESIDAHYALAQYHASLDGTPALLPSLSAVDWLERVHHLAGSGPKGASEWETLELAAPEHYWDRGRALSLAGDYAGAATVYAECIKKFGPSDSYAQHYFGFNIDRAGGNPDTAEAALRAAVDHERDNPWWNARLITFLIEHARYLAATREWREALERVDPTGERVASDGWLAHHFHYWVVEAWLEEGQIELARDAFDAIPADIVLDSPNLCRLEERLLDAEEAHVLGESVYPASIPVGDRWIAPRSPLPERSVSGARRLAWYPGRVIDTHDDAVMIVFATPSPDPAARRVKVRELTAADWSASARSRPEGFFELASYEDGTVAILPIDDRAPDWAQPVDMEHALRHFRADHTRNEY